MNYISVVVDDLFSVQVVSSVSNKFLPGNVFVSPRSHTPIYSALGSRSEHESIVHKSIKRTYQIVFSSNSQRKTVSHFSSRVSLLYIRHD